MEDKFKAIKTAIINQDDNVFREELNLLAQGQRDDAREVIFSIVIEIIISGNASFFVDLKESFSEDFNNVFLKKCFGLSLMALAAETHAFEFLNSLKDFWERQESGEITEQILSNANTIVDYCNFAHSLCRQASEFFKYPDLSPYYLDFSKGQGWLAGFDSRGYLPLHVLFVDNQFSPPESFVAFFQLLISEVTREGETILHLYIKQDVTNIRLEKLSYLVETLGVDINVVSRDGSTTLSLAAKYVSVECFSYLYTKADIKDNAPLDGTLWHEAARAGNIEVTNYLLGQNVPDISKSDRLGHKPLHYAAMFGRDDVVTKLLSVNAEYLNEHTQETALHLSAQHGHEYVTQQLLEKLSQEGVNQLNGKGYAALHLAMRYNRIECVRALLNHAKVNKELPTRQGQNIYHLFAKFRFVKKEIWDVLETAFNSNGNDRRPAMLKALDAEGRTPLHIAAMYSSKAIGYFLALNLSADNWNKQDNLGNTPLHCAYKCDRGFVIDKLLKIPNINQTLTNTDDVQASQVEINVGLQEEVELEQNFNYRAMSRYEKTDEEIPQYLPFNVTYSLPARVFQEDKPEAGGADELCQYYIRFHANPNTLADLKWHFARLIDLAFYTFIAYWQAGATNIARENEEMVQHGAAPACYHASHDSFISQRFFDTKGDHEASLFFVAPVIQGEPVGERDDSFDRFYTQRGILDGTHLLDSLNATTGIPKAANSFDKYIEKGVSGIKGVRQDYFDFLLDLAKGESLPVFALTGFLKLLRDRVDAIGRSNYIKCTSTEPIEVRRVFVNGLRESIVNVFNLQQGEVLLDYVCLLLRMTPQETQYVNQQAEPQVREAILISKQREIRAEIFASRSTFLRQYPPEIRGDDNQDVGEDVKKGSRRCVCD